MFIYTRITILVPRVFSSPKFGCKKRRKYVYFSTFAEKHGAMCKRSPTRFGVSESKNLAKMCISEIRLLWLEFGAFFRLETRRCRVL